ncbi:MAG: OadG family protein [Clostridiales bacterium]|nr:OadG family protein [Clostridiales bacterium]
MPNFLLVDGAMSFAGLVTVTGLLIVFSVLILLIIIFKLFGVIMSAISKAKKKKSKLALKNKSASVANSNSNNVKAEEKASPATAPKVEKGISNEIVAVIAAAVAAFGGGKIKSIKKSSTKSNGRSSWANAGVVDNTKPF